MLAQKRIPLFFLYILFMLPIILVYMFIFISSMDTALDRIDYLALMDPNSLSRIEPILPIIAYSLDFFVSNHVIKLSIIQFSFFLLLTVSVYNYFLPKYLISLSKCFLVLLLCLILLSNPLGVQLRLGYATILFLYIIITFKEANYLKVILLLFISFFMHYGVIFSILFFSYIRFFNIDTSKKFVFHTIIILTILTLVFSNIDFMFNLLGLSAYYLIYLSGELEFGRALPYSVIMYVGLCFYIFLYIKEKNNPLYWFSLSGLWLVYVGFVLDFYLAFKFLVPISIFALFYVVNNLPKIKQPYAYTIAAYLLMPLAFYYFAIQVNYI